jgi:hypothetical protein
MHLEENQKSFDIREFSELITKANKRKGFYECPNCSKPQLTIDSISGEYNCWSCKDIKAIAQNLRQNKLSSDPPSSQAPQNEDFSSIETEPDFAQISLEIDQHKPPEEPKPPEEDSRIGKRARVFADDWSPEAIGAIELVRGHGSSQALEIRIDSNQPGPRVRVVFENQWELIEGEEG